MDLLLRPKFKYTGEEFVPTMLQRLHHAFIDVKHNLQQSHERNKKYRDGNSAIPEFEIGDKILYRNNQPGVGLSKKLAKHWQPYYRVLEKRSPVNYVIKHLPSGTTKLVHASHMLPVDPDVEWEKEFSTPEEIISSEDATKLKAAAACPAVLPTATQRVKVAQEPTRRQPVRSCRLSAPLMAEQEAESEDSDMEMDSPDLKRRTETDADDDQQAEPKRRRVNLITGAVDPKVPEPSLLRGWWGGVSRILGWSTD